MPKRFKPVNNDIRHATSVVRVFLPGTGAAQSRLRVVVFAGRQVRLRAPFHDDKRKRNSQDRDAETSAEAPVVGDAFGAIVGVVLEVDVAAAGAPDGGHAVAVLVGAEDLSHEDVGEPAGVTNFEKAEDEDFPAVSSRETFPAVKESTDRGLEALLPASGFLVRELAVKTCKYSGDDVLFWDYAFRHKPPDESFHRKVTNGYDVEDDIATASTAKPYCRSEVGNYKCSQC